MESMLSDQQVASAIFGSAISVVLLIVIMAWSVVWKGIALYKAGQRSDTPWFVILFLINTAGILEIIYIFAVAKKK